MAIVLVLALAATLAGQEAPPPNPPPPEDPAIARVRKALRAATGYSGRELEPTFKVRIEGPRTLGDILPQLDVDAGPPLPGGWYAFDQLQRTGNPWAGQPIVKVDLWPIGATVRSALRDIRERQARDKVKRALTEFCEQHACR
jgi:hypothetical protein